MSYEHIFDKMQIDTFPFALCELQGKCDMDMGGPSRATLHYILAGRGEITFKNRPPVEVNRGSLVLIPASTPHILRSFGETGEPIPFCQPAELNLEQHLHKNEEGILDGRLMAICSHVKVGMKGVNDLVDLLRQPLVEHVVADKYIVGPVELLLQELSAPTMGSRAMVQVLLLQCMIQLLRKRLLADDPALNWMEALIDEGLWSALRLMLDKPGDPHTVESLANSAGMSRSSFAEHFAAAYGSGPMALLRGLRMNHACSLLGQSSLPVKRIAALVGFQSRSAFSRAFESAIGKSPRHYRADSHKIDLL